MAHLCSSCDGVCMCSGDVDGSVVGYLAFCVHPGCPLDDANDTTDDFDNAAARADGETF